MSWVTHPLNQRVSLQNSSVSAPLHAGTVFTQESVNPFKGFRAKDFGTNREVLSLYMKFNKQVSNQSGFTILSMLMGLMIMGIAMSALADMIRLSNKASRNLEVSQEIQMRFQRAKDILDYQDTCTGSIVGQTVGGAITIVNPANLAETIAAADTPSKLTWKVKSVSMTELGPHATQASVFRGRVEVAFQKDMKFVVGAPIVTKYVDEIYYEKTGSTVTKCYGSAAGLSMAKSNCEMLGGKWENGNPFGSQCDLSQQSAQNNGKN